MTDGVRRVLITGTYCSLNRGDATMQLVCADGISERIPGVQIAIHTPFPELDGPFYKSRGFPVVSSSRRNLPLGTLRWASLALTGRNAAGSDEGAPPGSKRWSPSNEWVAINEADWVVDLSGDMLTEDYGPHVAYSHYLPLLQTIAAGRNLAICAQSVGPFRYTKPLARKIFSGADLVTLREEQSREHVASLGAEIERLEVTADLAFALDPGPGHAVEAALEHAGADRHSGPWIGVSLSGLVEQFRRRRGVANSSLAEALAPGLMEVADSAGAGLLLVPHAFGFKSVQDDRRALSNLKGHLGGLAEERVVLIEDELDPEILKGILARCGMVVGARMHACMAALSSGVPVLALSYSHKATGIMEYFEVGEWVVDAHTVEASQLTRAMSSLLESRSEIADRVARHAARARRDAVRNLDLLEELISEERAQ